LLSLSHTINHISKLGNSGPQDEGSYVHPKHCSQIMRLNSALTWNTTYKVNQEVKWICWYTCCSWQLQNWEAVSITNTRHYHEESVSGLVSVVSVYISSFNMGAPLWNSELWSDFCGQKAFKTS
jgi:hypothetical protein